MVGVVLCAILLIVYSKLTWFPIESNPTVMALVKENEDIVNGITPEPATAEDVQALLDSFSKEVEKGNVVRTRIMLEKMLYDPLELDFKKLYLRGVETDINPHYSFLTRPEFIELVSTALSAVDTPHFKIKLEKLTPHEDPYIKSPKIEFSFEGDGLDNSGTTLTPIKNKIYGNCSGQVVYLDKTRPPIVALRFCETHVD